MIVGVVCLATGCSTVMLGLAGKPPAAGQAVATSAAPQAPVTTAFVADSTLTPEFSGQAVLPPTLPVEAGAADDEPPDPGSAGPHHPIAVAPLSTEAAALSPLSAAAIRSPANRDSRFVLLVLTPPATDASALDRATGEARLAAAAAVRALSESGVVPDHVEVSLATNPNAGPGEMRLYMR
jgi:hypothetical protein